MPIYAYKCAACGYEQDVLQKLSDAPLTVCPQCGKPDFSKQITAAGFQLKGSGWYVTDFRGGSKGGDSKGGSDSKGGDAKSGDSKSGAGSGTATSTTSSSATSTSSGSSSTPSSD